LTQCRNNHQVGQQVNFRSRPFLVQKKSVSASRLIYMIRVSTLLVSTL
jgi:hypothetical protein